MSGEQQTKQKPKKLRSFQRLIETIERLHGYARNDIQMTTTRERRDLKRIYK